MGYVLESQGAADAGTGGGAKHEPAHADLRGAPGEPGEGCSSYTAIAPLYDATVGREGFSWIRRALGTILFRHGIRYRTAADIGCGTGRLAALIARTTGAHVYGVDRSRDMLRVASLRTRGLPVSLVRQDVRLLRLGQPVDLVTATFDVLNHLADAGAVRAAIHAIAENLRPGGHFVFDMLTPWQPSALEGRVRRYTSRLARVEQHIRLSPDGRRLEITLVVGKGRGAPVLERHVEGLYDPVDVARWLAGAGFVVRRIYDAVTLQRPRGLVPRVLIVAQKLVRRPRETKNGRA